MIYFILFIASMFCLRLVVVIKNDILRAALGIPIIVAMFMLGMITFASAISAQWVPDRPDYEVLSDGNFYTKASDMNTALSIALNTLEYNNAKMHTVDVDRSDIDAPLFSHFHRNNEFVYIAYVARTTNGYVVWFRYLPEQRYEFEEEYVVLEYEGMD